MGMLMRKKGNWILIFLSIAEVAVLIITGDIRIVLSNLNLMIPSVMLFLAVVTLLKK
jgi:hypothetical protein